MQLLPLHALVFFIFFAYKQVLPCNVNIKVLFFFGGGTG